MVFTGYYGDFKRSLSRKEGENYAVILREVFELSYVKVQNRTFKWTDITVS